MESSSLKQICAVNKLEQTGGRYARLSVFSYNIHVVLLRYTRSAAAGFMFMAIHPWRAMAASAIAKVETNANSKAQ